MAVDIGGTLAKTAFYLPKNDPHRLDSHKLEMLTKDTISSKFTFLEVEYSNSEIDICGFCGKSRIAERRQNLPKVVPVKQDWRIC